MNRRTWLLAVVLVLASASLATARTWTDQQGRTIEAKFVRVHNGQVVLLRASRAMTVPLANFSAEDQKYIREQTQGEGGASGLPGLPSRPPGMPALPSSPDHSTRRARPSPFPAPPMGPGMSVPSLPRVNPSMPGSMQDSMNEARRRADEMRERMQADHDRQTAEMEARAAERERKRQQEREEREARWAEQQATQQREAADRQRKLDEERQESIRDMASGDHGMSLQERDRARRQSQEVFNRPEPPRPAMPPSARPRTTPQNLTPSMPTRDFEVDMPEVGECSNCGKTIVGDYGAGDNCPHCGIHFDYEETADGKCIDAGGKETSKWAVGGGASAVIAAIFVIASMLWRGFINRN